MAVMGQQVVANADSREHRPQGKWAFDEGVAVCFDDMLERSIPQYDVMRRAVAEVAQRYIRPSALSSYDFRVQGLQFVSCIFDGELPVYSSLLVVAGHRPSIGLLSKHLDVCNAAA